MLFKQNNRSAIRGIISTSLLALLAGCSNSAAIEGFISADPQLKENQLKQSSNATQPKTSLNSSTANSQQETSARSSLKEDPAANSDLNNPDNDVREEKISNDLQEFEK